VVWEVFGVLLFDDGIQISEVLAGALS